MRRDGIVESTRGPGGGYSLGRVPAAITVADIVSSVDDPMENTEGENAADGLSQALWQRLNETMLQHMASISLQTLVEEQKAQGGEVELKPVRRAIQAQPVLKPPRTTAPNSVFAFGRSFAR